MKKLLLLLTFLSLTSGIFAQVSKTVNVSTAGTLSSTLASNELATITNLTVTGTIDARDFKTMRDKMPLLAVLDMSGVTIAAYYGSGGTSPSWGDFNYPANNFPNYAFSYPNTEQGKINLISIVLPTSCTTIDSFAFAHCNGLTNVTIPSSVKSLKQYVFYYCSGMNSIIIPSSVNSIGFCTFAMNSGLVSVDSNNPNYSSLDGVLYDKAQTTLISCPISKIGSFTIPSSVTSIEIYAFLGCKGLTIVTIPSSVTSIGDDAFEFCNGLTTVTIPSSVTSISMNAFKYCSGLITVTIPSSVTSIGVGAFRYCSSLTTVGIPLSMTLIEDYAFDGCKGLTTVTIPSSVTRIGMRAFQDCTGLTSITTTRLIPINLSSLNVFYQVNKTTCKLYVPVGSKSAYQVADQWKDFTNIVEKDFTGIDPIISDQKLNTYPNPTTGKVKLVFDQIPIKGTTLTVNDFTGKTILTQSIQNKEEWIDLKGNSPGVYLIRTNMKDFKVQKIILK